MPFNRKAAELGAFDKKEIELFWRVFDATRKPGETDADADLRASRIIATYSAGITDENELIELSRKLLGR
jgi:hypothetical protein